jgi:hypothetical protein
MRRMRTRLPAVVVALVAAVAVVAVPVSPAAAASTYYSVLDPDLSTPDPNRRMVLGIDGGSTANRARAILSTFRGDLNQYWTKTAIYSDSQGRAVYQIRNAKSGKCLDKSVDAPDANGNVVYQYTCLNPVPNNQMWYTWSGASSRGNWKHLANLSGGRCLDIQGPSHTNGAVLHIWSCYNTWSQQWNII